jgi:cephalosporin-C deacetylase-like acetyl esterase
MHRVTGCCHLCVSALLVFSSAVLGQDAQEVPASSSPSPEVPSQEIMAQWLERQTQERFAQWNADYESRTTQQQILDYQKKQRAFFLEQLGGLPERTPLNAQVTGEIQREGYRVEKVLFESQPGLVISSALFLPDSSEFEAPYPAVLVVCGHSAQAKAYTAYQTACALAAKNGIAAFIIDPIGQGERYQHLDAKGKVELPSTTAGHSLLGLGCMLLGQNVARFEVWDGMRAIDYLQSRDDIDGSKIGCMGNSGGGTQTAYLMALEDRIVAASPACYITSFSKLLSTIGPQDAEQNIHGQLGFGMDHADYLMMRAPTPILICCSTRDFFDIEGTWDSFRKAKRLYERLGYPERISLVETDNQHGWHQPLREAAVQWMVRWLDGRDIPIAEEGIELIDEKELWASPQGQVLMMPGGKSGFDLNSDTQQQFAAQRAKLWETPEAAIAAVRELAGIRPLENLKPTLIQRRGVEQGDGCTITQLVLQTPDGIPLAANLYRPITDRPQEPKITLFFHGSGKEGDDKTLSPLSWVKQGRTVLAVDVRGTGETRPADAVWYDPRFGEDGKHLVTAYLLGKSYVGMRAEDILTATLAASQLSDAANLELQLVGVGEAALPALHAAAVEPGRFTQVHIDGCLESWAALVEGKYSKDQLVHVVHGGLTAYDIPDLIQHLGDKVKWTRPQGILP